VDGEAPSKKSLYLFWVFFFLQPKRKRKEGKKALNENIEKNQ
jgi:hypothetical protein